MNAEPVAMRRPIEGSPRPQSVPPPIIVRSTGFVRFAKYALPIAAIGLAVLIFAWARINPVIERLQLSETELAPQEIESAAMENARFAGVDAENRVFVSDFSDHAIKVYERGRLVARAGHPGGGLGQFRHISDLWMDEGLLYVADSLNGRVQILRVASESR